MSSGSPAVSYRGVPTRSASPLPHQQGTQNPFGSRPSSPASGSPSLKKPILKNSHAQHRPPNSYANHQGSSPYTTHQQPPQMQRQYSSTATPLQPSAPIPIMQQPAVISNVSSYNSYDQGEDSMHSSSENRSFRNLGTGVDPNYNLTQSDMTLEGLAERWNAYQAMMAKYYKEVPFYRRWTKSKWVLILTVVLLLAYSIMGLLISIGFLTKRIEHSVLVLEFHSNLVYLCLAASVVGIVTGIIGAIGIWRENRVWLSIYNLLLWVVFALFTAIGYVAFLRAKDYLRSHVRNEWLHQYTRQQRLLVQRELKCCGYTNSKSAAEYDLRCFPGTVLYGCEHKYNIFERDTLQNFWMSSFILVPIELFVMLAALLCANHVDGMWRSARPGLVSFKEEKKKWQ